MPEKDLESDILYKLVKKKFFFKDATLHAIITHWDQKENVFTQWNTKMRSRVFHVRG